MDKELTFKLDPFFHAGCLKEGRGVQTNLQMFKLDKTLVDGEVVKTTLTLVWYCCTTAHIAKQKEVSYCIILSFKSKKVTKASHE